MPNLFQELQDQIKVQNEKHYRWIRQDPTNVSRRKFQGYEYVMASDPAVKGTILELHYKDEHGHIGFGDLALMQISRQRWERLRAQLDGKQQAMMDSIHRSYLETGEGLKQQMGKKHAALKMVVEKDEE